MRWNLNGPCNADVIVLGAGMIGVSTALHLQKRGRSVALLDRRGPGEETSFGNTGIIQREGVVPYPFPRQIGLMVQYALALPLLGGLDPEAAGGNGTSSPSAH
jgi:glycine/D-amino acid oxidase-like deaminating enzyme